MNRHTTPLSDDREGTAQAAQVRPWYADEELWRMVGELWAVLGIPVALLAFYPRLDAVLVVPLSAVGLCAGPGVRDAASLWRRTGRARKVFAAGCVLSGLAVLFVLMTGAAFVFRQAGD